MANPLPLLLLSVFAPMAWCKLVAALLSENRYFSLDPL
jgi:hypothetical protein